MSKKNFMYDDDLYDGYIDKDGNIVVVSSSKEKPEKYVIIESESGEEKKVQLITK